MPNIKAVPLLDKGTHSAYLLPPMNPKTHYEIHQEITHIVKVYPNFIRLLKFHSSLSARIAGYESRDEETNNSAKTSLALDDNLHRSLRRTKTTITDIVICNEFDLFVTFTFAKDRQNINRLKKQMSTWLKNQKRIVGSFSYLIVPEFHADRQSIHFHALFKDYQGKLTDSGHKINNRRSYNIPSYRLGFSSAVKIDNIEKVGNYVQKYITKDMPNFNGKKRYWLSTGLKRPITLINSEVIDNPFLNWRKVYNNEYLEMFETNGSMSILTKEKESWQEKSNELVSLTTEL